MDIKILGLAKTKLKSLTSWLSDNAPKAKVEEVVEIEVPAPKEEVAAPAPKGKGKKAKPAPEPTPEPEPEPEPVKKGRKKRDAVPAPVVLTRDSILTDAIFEELAENSSYIARSLKDYARQWNVKTIGQAIDHGRVPGGIKTTLRNMVK